MGFTILCGLPVPASQILQESGSLLAAFVLPLVTSLLYMACMGAVAVAASETDDGVPSAGECLSRAFSRIPAFLLLVILLFVLAIGVSVPLTLGIAIGAKTGSPAPVMVFFSLIFVAFLAWLYVSLCLTVPALVLEDLGAMASLRRSMELTRGFRLKILVIFLIVAAGALPSLGLFSYWEISESISLNGFFKPTPRYLFINSALLVVMNTVTFAFLAVIYRTCSGILESSRVEDYSEVF